MVWSSWSVHKLLCCCTTDAVMDWCFDGVTRTLQGNQVIITISVINITDIPCCGWNGKRCCFGLCTPGNVIMINDLVTECHHLNTVIVNHIVAYWSCIIKSYKWLQGFYCVLLSSRSRLCTVILSCFWRGARKGRWSSDMRYSQVCKGRVGERVSESERLDLWTS